jgi:hypothetical protein
MVLMLLAVLAILCPNLLLRDLAPMAARGRNAPSQQAIADRPLTILR